MLIEDYANLRRPISDLNQMFNCLIVGILSASGSFNSVFGGFAEVTAIDYKGITQLSGFI
jgi:hypothetical protein